MTHFKMPKQVIDDKLSTKWGLAALKSVGFGLKGVIGSNVRVFDLINMDTYRAHRMTITDISGSVGLPVSVSLLSSDYSYFETKRPANFSDFHKRNAEVGTTDLVVYSWSNVKIFEGMKLLAEVKSSGWGLATPEVGSSTGITEIYFSDGKPLQDPRYETRVDIPSQEDLTTGYEVTANADSLVIRLKGDVLFDFGEARLHYQATAALGEVMKFINTTSGYKRIVIEGHTDSKEKVPGFNQILSKRRADAVKDYFIKYKDFLDSTYPISTVGKAATKPIAPNKNPDGSDNPLGREKNRRVEIFLYKR